MMTWRTNSKGGTERKNRADVSFRSVFKRIGRSSALTLLLLAVSGGASAQVILQPVASPAEAPPILTSVSVTGSGFPSGTINAGNVSVTITPPNGNGSPVSVAASNVTPSVGGSTRTVQFFI